MALKTMQVRVLSAGRRFQTLAAVVGDRSVTYWAEGPGLKLIREYGGMVEDANEVSPPTSKQPGFQQYQAICRAAAGGFDADDIDELLKFVV